MALTEHERHAAAPALDRKTSPEIAAQLFVRLKTVETHRRNIFDELGASSRHELERGDV